MGWVPKLLLLMNGSPQTGANLLLLLGYLRKFHQPSFFHCCSSIQCMHIYGVDEGASCFHRGDYSKCHYSIIPGPTAHWGAVYSLHDIV